MASSLLKDLIDRVQRLADREDPAYRARVLDALDEACQWHAMVLPMESLTKHEDFYASGEFLILPDRVGSPVMFFDKTNKRPLEPDSHFERRDPGVYADKTAGAPLRWRPAGYSPVVRDLSTNATLVLASSASEVMAVQVRGLIHDTAASGTALEYREVVETITLGGTSEASSNYYHSITSIQKDKATESDLIVSTALDGIISRIPSWETRPLFQRIQLMPASNGTVLSLEYFKRPDRLTSEDDPIDPGLVEEALVWRAVGNAHWFDNETQNAQAAWAKANEAISIKRNAQETFGEKDHGVEPWTGYVRMEDWYWEE